MFAIQTGLDTTKPVITNNGNTILIAAGGIVEVNGSLFKLANDVGITIPNIHNDYYIYIHDNGDGTADIDLSDVYPTFISSKNGWYTADNERVLDNFYMRKTFVKKDINNENIDAISFIDLDARPIVRTTLENLSSARASVSAAALGDGSVLFGGGVNNATVDKYDINGVRTTLENLSVARWCAAAPLGDGSVLFGGGITSNWSDVVDKYDINGVRTTLTSLSEAKEFYAAATLGDGSVLFGGGVVNSTVSAVVDKYDINGVRTTLTSLSQARNNLAAATLGDGSVLFGGGSAAVDKYDIDGVRTTLENLSVARTVLAASTLGDGSVLFGGGNSSGATAVVDKYDINGVRTTLENLSQARNNLAAATLGDGSVLFGGGSNPSAVVDKYSSSITLNLSYGSTYRFDDDTSEKPVKSPISKSTPNKGYVRYNSSLVTI
jgi:hypothetical protein